MTAINVRHLVRDRFAIDIRGHTIHVDQPTADGGDDTAPTPTELCVASLASCVAFYARRYLERHDLPTDGLAVTASYDLAARPARVAHIHVDVVISNAVPAERREALLRVASHCTVHNTLDTPPRVDISLTARPAAAA